MLVVLAVIYKTMSSTVHGSTPSTTYNAPYFARSTEYFVLHTYLAVTALVAQPQLAKTRGKLPTWKLILVEFGSHSNLPMRKYAGHPQR